MKFRARAAGVALLVAVSGALSSCSVENADNAVAQGETFQFISPGGQTVIEYPVHQRAKLKHLSGPSLRDEKQTISLDDYAGQIVVLNSWGQWCAPCRSESDDLERVHEELQKRGTGTVLGINIRDFNPQISRDFVKDNGLTYPSIFDPPFRTAAALGGVPTAVVPTTVILDKRHRPAAVLLKETTDQELMAIIDKLEKE